MGFGDRKGSKQYRKRFAWCPPCKAIAKPDGSTVFAYAGKYYREVGVPSLRNSSAKLERWFARMARR